VGDLPQSGIREKEGVGWGSYGGKRKKLREKTQSSGGERMSKGRKIDRKRENSDSPSRFGKRAKRSIGETKQGVKTNAREDGRLKVF